MSRVTDALLGGRAFSSSDNIAMLDVSKGGQFGYAPNLKEWVSNQAYVRNNHTGILLEAPGFFKVMPNPEKWVESLRALVELHARSIEGLNAGLTVETDEHPVGGAGEFQQEIIDVKRARSEPSFTFIEKYGMPIQNFLKSWITYGLMDPDSKYPLIGTLPNSGSVPNDMLADWYSMSCLFMETDPTHQFALKSWVTTNMFPKGTGEIIGKRDTTASKEILTLTVEFTGISQFGMGGDGTNAFAQSILNSINMANANPNQRPSFIQNIASDVAASKASYVNGITELGSNAVTSYPTS